jgi:hypothetical protein
MGGSCKEGREDMVYFFLVGWFELDFFFAGG